MTDLATLAIKVDSTQADDAAKSLDKLSAAGKRAEGSTNAAGKEWVKASSAAGKLRMEQYSAAQAAEQMAKSTKGAGAAAAEMAKKAQEAARGVNNFGKSAGLAAHHSQNLVFQLQDIFIGLTSGQKPMTVFMQQGSQIAGIMMQAGIGVGGLVKQLLAMAGASAVALATNPLFLAMAGTMAVLAAGVGLVTDEINKNSSVTVTWKDVLLGAFDVVKEAISSRVTAAFQAMGLDIGEVWEAVKKYTKIAINFIIGAATAVPRLIAATYDKIPAAFGDAFYSAANLAIDALNKLAKMSAVPMNAIIDGLNWAFGTKIPHVVVDGLDNIANPYKGAMAALGKAGAQSLVSSFQTDYIGNIASALSDAAQNRARIREAAEKAGEKAGKAGGQKMGRAMAKAAADEFEKEWDKFSLSLSKDVAKLTKELAKGLDQTTLKDISAGINKALDVKFDEKAETARRLNDQLRDMASILQGMGGIGGAIGNALAFLSGNTGSIGGPLGALLGMLTGGSILRDGREVAETIGCVLSDKMTRLFDNIGMDFKTILQGAGTGVIAGQAILGKQGTGGQLGSAIGGALGQKLGEKFLSKGFETIAKGLGDFAGPLGSIAGGIIGGLVGGLFKKTKTGTATIGAGLGISLGGNNGERKDLANQAAGSVVDAMKQIADALGGQLDKAVASVTIGIRKKNYIVDPTGQGRTKGAGVINFGQDQEAAIAYAIKDLINDGVITGIRQSTMNLLKAGGDLQAALDKALAFESVFDELKRRTDPLGYELDQIAKKFANLTTIFKEAGATADEMAQLQQLQALEVADAQKAAADTAAQQAEEAARKRADQLNLESQLLALQGKATQALAKAREAELLQIDASQKAIQQQIYAEQDAATRRQLQIQLLEAQGNAEAALALSRAEIMRNTLDDNKALQEQIFLAQDIASAKDALSAAYERESSALQDTADKMKAFGDTLRDFRKELTGTADNSMSYTQALTKLMQVGALASTGDTTALGDLPGVGRDFLSAAKNNSGSLQEYQRAVALVARYTDQAIGFTDNAVSTAEQQLAEMKTQVGALIDINQSVISVADAIQKLTALMTQVIEVPDVPVMDVGSGSTPRSGHKTQEERRAEKRARDDEKQAQRDALMEQQTRTLSNLLSIFKTVTADGTSFKISTWEDDPLAVATP